MSRIFQLSADRIKGITKNVIAMIHELTVKHILDLDASSKESIINTVMTEVSIEADNLMQYTSDLITQIQSTLDGSMFNDIQESVKRARNEIDTEMDVILLTKNKNDISSVFNIYNYGTAHSIQAGQNNYLTQNLSEKDEKLASAINNLLQELTLHGTDSFSSDLIKTVQDALVELNCPEKNYFKIQSYLMTMTTLQTLPALKPAVTTLATAYDYYFGTNVAAQLV